MSKDEVIQNLFDQIHSINDHYLAIIAIVLVLTSIAFSSLMWLQLRASKEQYNKMKAELENEMVVKYNLRQVSILSESADRKIKMSLSRIIMDLAVHEVNDNAEVSSETQRDWVNRLRLAEDSLDRDVFKEDRRDVASLIYTISKKILEDKTLNITSNNKRQLEALVDRTNEKHEYY
ncbi:hypothetical protein [Levilactobacillus angrenensis]|uniref:Uncharacterized protein n=1 Tax=Levilactobacillus angrenensis TaxID=2486020 RepID=A0ABW1U538_9LACO|nr:hypothetical protein [Levilactobacillus angrenensis]